MMNFKITGHIPGNTGLKRLIQQCTIAAMVKFPSLGTEIYTSSLSLLVTNVMVLIRALNFIIHDFLTKPLFSIESHNIFPFALVWHYFPL